MKEVQEEKELKAVGEAMEPVEPLASRVLICLSVFVNCAVFVGRGFSP